MKSVPVAVVLGGALLHVFVLYATWWGAMDGEARRSRIYFSDGGNGMYAILGLGALGLLALVVLGVRFALRPNTRSWPLFVAPFLAPLLGEALERRAVAKALEAFQTPASWAQQAPNLAEMVHAASATSTLGLMVSSTLLSAASWPFAARSLNERTAESPARKARFEQDARNYRRGRRTGERGLGRRQRDRRRQHRARPLHLPRTGPRSRSGEVSQATQLTRHRAAGRSRSGGPERAPDRAELAS